MALVFVSYSHDDEAFVLKLLDDLRQNHVPFWFDGHIPTGQRWDKYIQRQLTEATHLLFVMSESSVESDNVLDEVIFALDTHKTIIPIRIDNCTPPYRLSRLQHIDFRKNPAQALKRLLKALPGEASPPAEPQPSPARRKSGHYAFWESLLERARARTTLHLRISPQTGPSIAATAGVPGLKFRYAIHRRAVSVQLAIDVCDRSRNKIIFDRLAGSRPAIEAAFGGPLAWERLDNHKASRLIWMLAWPDRADEAAWPPIQEAMIDAMIRLEKALRPHLDALSQPSPGS